MNLYLPNSILKTLALTLLLATDILSIAQSGIYVGGHIRRERPGTIAKLKSSGFTDIILFNIQVEPNGNLTTDGEMICQNGQYVFGNTQPEYVDDIMSLKEGVTGVKRIESCIGGWGNHSYDNIKSLINAQGTGSNTNMYKNFQALKQAIPVIEYINNDDEGTYDVSTATQFHVMLADIGFKTTLAPYRDKAFWEALSNNLNAQRPGALNRVYIQCYDGGAGNNPCDWHLGGVPLFAGLLHFDSQETISSRMTGWRNNCGVVGGFLWVYNAEDFDLWNYATTINNVYGQPRMDKGPVATVYPDCDFNGRGVTLSEGEFTLGQLQSMGIKNDWISSLKVLKGYEIEVFLDDNFSGGSLTYSTEDACLVNENYNDKITSIKVRAKGVSGLNGQYFVRNKKSNKYLDLANGAEANGTNYVQWHFGGGANQKFNLVEIGNGVYKFLSEATGKSLDISAIDPTDRANVQQWAYVGSANQQFIAVRNEEGYFQFVARHSGKIIEISGGSTEAGANVMQYKNNNQQGGLWELIPTNAVTGNGSGLQANYFNGMDFETPVLSKVDDNVNFNWGGSSPVQNVGADHFSVRWTGKVQAKYSGEHTFYLTSDDGQRLWVNGQVLIDKWNDDSGTEYSGKITLQAGEKVKMRIDYFENEGSASVNFKWSTNVLPKQVVPKAQLFPNELPVISLSNPTNNSVYQNSESIQIVASASDPDGSIFRVEIYDNDALLTRLNNSPYQFDWSGMSTGNHVLKARAYDEQRGLSISSDVNVMIDEVTGAIEETGDSKFNVYPNPVHGILTVEGDINELQLFTTQGQLIQTTTASQIDMSQLPTASYLLKIVRDTEVIIKTFIKE